MYMREKSVPIAGLSSGAPADVRQTHATGKIEGVYDYGCDLFRKRIECAIMLKVAEDAENLK